VLAVSLEDLLHIEERRRAIFEREGDGLGATDPLHALVIGRDGDGDAPHQPGGEAHLVQHPSVVLLPHESGEGGQGAGGQHLQVGGLARAQGELRQLRGLLRGELRLLALEQQLDQLSAVRCD
jgi:hypothetical protein